MPLTYVSTISYALFLASLSPKPQPVAVDGCPSVTLDPLLSKGVLSSDLCLLTGDRLIAGVFSLILEALYLAI